MHVASDMLEFKHLSMGVTRRLQHTSLNNFLPCLRPRASSVPRRKFEQQDAVPSTSQGKKLKQMMPFTKEEKYAIAGAHQQLLEAVRNKTDYSGPLAALRSVCRGKCMVFLHEFERKDDPLQVAERLGACLQQDISLEYWPSARRPK
jgi:hypothetical protein